MSDYIKKRKNQMWMKMYTFSSIYKKGDKKL